MEGDILAGWMVEGVRPEDACQSRTRCCATCAYWYREWWDPPYQDGNYGECDKLEERRRYDDVCDSWDARDAE